jgi:hypothetical protein
MVNKSFSDFIQCYRVLWLGYVVSPPLVGPQCPQHQRLVFSQWEYLLIRESNVLKGAEKGPAAPTISLSCV